MFYLVFSKSVIISRNSKLSSAGRTGGNGDGREEEGRVRNRRVRKVEEEVGCGKGSKERQYERGGWAEEDVCCGNFIYYFSHWHSWTIDDHVDVNCHYATADCNK